MAKSKAVSRKSKSKASSKISRTLPDGYKALNSRAPAWKHEEEPVLIGERVRVHTITLDKGTKKEREQRIMTVDSADLGQVAVFESAALTSLFDESEDGQGVFIEFTGMGTAKKGQNAPKLFNTGVAE